MLTESQLSSIPSIEIQNPYYPPCILLKVKPLMRWEKIPKSVH